MGIGDQLVAYFGERDVGFAPNEAQKIIGMGFDPAVVADVLNKVTSSEYKRRQAAPGLKVTSRAFGFGRRMPIAQNYVSAVPTHGEPSPVLK